MRLYFICRESAMKCLFNKVCHVFIMLEKIAPWCAWLLLRVLIGWEFLESGLEKYHGENWFFEVQAQFPFPFNIIPADISWSLATNFEIVGGIALMIGLATRFFAVTMMILTWVATVAVHWPERIMFLSDLIKGYSITNEGYGNFKLPLLFVAMLIPLLFLGAGKLSVDALLKTIFPRFFLRNTQ